MSETPAVLRYGDKEIELPVVRGTENEIGLDISKLRAQTGAVTLDGGFVNTASTESAITFIDGDAGILRYRGIPIEEMAEHGSFLETSYLLIWGELPTAAQLEVFRFAVRKHTLLHEDAKRFFDAFPQNAHPMATLSSVVSALSTFYQDSNDPKDPAQVHQTIIRLMAKLPTIAAYSYKKSIGQPFMYPNNKLDLIENFLMMMFAVPSEEFHAKPEVVHALKLLLILHADHEQNCSTSTVRMVGSSEANLFASIAAGINALWGPLHGGANQAVVEMLEKIRDDGGDLGKYVNRAKDPKIRSASRDSVIACTRTTTHAHASSRRQPMMCSASSKSTILSSTSPKTSRRSRSTTTTSSSESCTRTSTSTRASSIERWAFPPTCSRSCSRSVASPAGLRTGRK